MHSDALEPLSDPVIATDHLGDVADHLIGHVVDQARRSGAFWTGFGTSLGVTKQTAEKCSLPKDSGGVSDLDPSQGSGRFTKRARNVVLVPQNEARAADNDEIRPEDVVSGLLSEPDALAAR